MTPVAPQNREETKTNEHEGSHPPAQPGTPRFEVAHLIYAKYVASIRELFERQRKCVPNQEVESKTKAQYVKYVYLA